MAWSVVVLANSYIVSFWVNKHTFTAASTPIRLKITLCIDQEEVIIRRIHTRERDFNGKSSKFVRLLVRLGRWVCFPANKLKYSRRSTFCIPSLRMQLRCFSNLLLHEIQAADRATTTKAVFQFLSILVKEYSSKAVQCCRDLERVSKNLLETTNWLTLLVWSGVAPSLYCLAILAVKLSIIRRMESRDSYLTDITLILRSYDFHGCIWTTRVCKGSSFFYALGIV